MNWKIQSNQVQRTQGKLAFQGSDESTRRAEAKTQLHQMAVSLIGSNDSIKSGYLKIVSHGAKELKLGTKWLGKSASTRDAKDLVHSLIKEAYGDKPGVEAMLSRYLEASGGRVGTQSFVKLVRALEAADTTQIQDRLHQAQPSGRARLDTSAVPGAFRLAELQGQVDRLATMLAAPSSLVDEVRLRQEVMATATEAYGLASTSGAEKVGRALYARAIAAGIPDTKLNLGQFSKFMPVGTLVAHATRGQVASQQDRDAVLRDMPAAFQDQLLEAFKSQHYDETLRGLLSADRDGQSPEARAAIAEFRAIEKQLLSIVAERMETPVQPAFAPAPADQLRVSAEISAPVTQALQAVVATLQSDQPLEVLGDLRRFVASTNQALSDYQAASGKPFESEDERAEVRQALLMSAFSTIDEHAAAAALHALRESKALELAFAPAEILGQASSESVALLGGDQFTKEVNNLQLQAEELAYALTMRTRGHTQISTQLPLVPPNQNLLLNLNSGQRAALWTAFADQPQLSIAECEATLSRAKAMKKSGIPESAQYLQARFRSNEILETLNQLTHVSASQRAQMGQMLSHPASTDPGIRFKFITLLMGSSSALLDACSAKAGLLSDAEIWQAVLGEPAPQDIQGNGDRALGARLVKEVERRYKEAATADAIKRFGESAPPPDTTTLDINLGRGLRMGLSIQTQLMLLQNPRTEVTRDDFFPSYLKVSDSKADLSNAYCQTFDIHRWQHPTLFNFELAPGQAGSSLDPNNHPDLAQRVAGEAPAVDDLVVVDMLSRIGQATQQREAQTQAVSIALTQASTSVFRFIAELMPMETFHNQIEHGAFTFTVTPQGNGDVRVLVRANDVMPFEGEMQLTVSPEGVITTDALRVRVRPAPAKASA